MRATLQPGDPMEMMMTLSRRLTWIITLLAVVSAFGQAAKQPPRRTTAPKTEPATVSQPAAAPNFQVKINGQKVGYRLIDGRYYVLLEDIARATAGVVAYTNDAASLTVEQKAAQQPAPPAPATPLGGKIRGSLSYYFNANYGNKPDSGTEVWLIAGEIEIPDDAVHLGTPSVYWVSVGEKRQRYEVVRHTMADGNGNFELTDVSEGRYTLVMKSSHTNARVARDLLGKTEVRHITVKNGETVDASYDFGTTYFSR